MNSHFVRRNAETLSERVWLAAVLVFITLVHATSYQSGLDWGGDYAGYLLQAKSIFDGSIDQAAEWGAFRQQYSRLTTIGPALYPWGFPLAISPVIALFGLSVIPMKVFIFVCALGAQIVTFFLLRGRMALPWVLLVVFIMGMNTEFFYFKNNIISDLLFTFLVLLSVWLMQRLIADKRVLISPIVDALLLGAVVYYAYFTRTHGIALLPVLASVQLVQACVQLVQIVSGKGTLSRGQRMRALRTNGLLYAIPYVVFAVAFLIERQVMPGSAMPYVEGGQLIVGREEDFSSASGFISLVLGNIQYYAMLPQQIIDIPYLDLFLAVGVFLPLCLYGAYHRLWADRVFLIFVLFYMGVLLVFPGRQGVRFILPIIPLYFYFAIVGATELQRHLEIRYRSLRHFPSLRVLIFVPTTLLLVLNVAIQWVMVETSEQSALDGPYMKTSQEMFDFVRSSTPESATFVYWKPRVFMLYGERKAAMVDTDLDAAPVDLDYVVVYMGEDALMRAGRSLLLKARNSQLYQNVEQAGDRFALIFCNKDFLIYQATDTRSAPTSIQEINRSTCLSPQDLFWGD